MNTPSTEFDPRGPSRTPRGCREQRVILLEDIECEAEALEACRYIHRRALERDGDVVVDISHAPTLPPEVYEFLRYMQENRLELGTAVTVLEPARRLDIWV